MIYISSTSAIIVHYMCVSEDLSPKLLTAIGIIKSDEKNCIAGKNISNFLGNVPSEQIFYRNIPLGAPAFRVNRDKETKKAQRVFIDF